MTQGKLELERGWGGECDPDWNKQLVQSPGDERDPRVKMICRVVPINATELLNSFTAYSQVQEGFQAGAQPSTRLKQTVLYLIITELQHDQTVLAYHQHFMAGGQTLLLPFNQQAQRWPPEG